MKGFASSLCKKSSAVFLASAFAASLCAPVLAQSAANTSGPVPKGYTTPIPAELFTPDQVDTSAGTFRFFDGMPDADTVDASFDYLKFIRAYETFLTLMPAASIEMMRVGHAQQGGRRLHEGHVDGPAEFQPAFPDRKHRHGLWLHLLQSEEHGADGD